MFLVLLLKEFPIPSPFINDEKNMCLGLSLPNINKVTPMPSVRLAMISSVTVYQHTMAVVVH